MYPQIKSILCSSYLIISMAAAVSSFDLFNIKFIEMDDSRLVATSNYNFALTSPKLSTKNWRTVSSNGNDVSIVTTTGEKLNLVKGSTLLEPDRIFIENLRDEIANSNTGLTQQSSSTSIGPNGSGSIMMSSGTGGSGGGMVSSSYSSAGSITSSTSGGTQGGTLRTNNLSVGMKDENNFWVSKSDLPFNWSRVFVIGDLVAFVTKDSAVTMSPLSALDAAQLEAIERLKTETKEMQKNQSRQASKTFQHSMDMVSNIFNNIMGNFPKPPSYESAVGSTFGNNFPFGSNNSPFSSSSGWPFSGNGAFAFAGGRRR